MKKIIYTLLLLLSINSIHAQMILTPTDEGSKVNFVIKNFGIRTNGVLTGLKGIIKFDPKNVSLWAFDVTVDASTIDTDNSSRDKHLKKADYFDVTKYPVIRIKSTKIQTTGTAGIYLLNADLTIKGVTKPVNFTFKVNNINNGYLFTGEFPMDRRDFQVGGSSVTLSDKLQVILSIFAK